MDMQKYMTFTASWKKKLGLDEDTRRPEYGDEVEIKCFKYGKDVFIRSESSAATITAKVYLTLESVQPGDILDGQVVKSVNSYPESWDSRVQLYEVLTWED